MNLSAIDLNLLVVLDALLAEASVTRAGRRLGLSQPAVSNALARLRHLFADPLFVRGPGGIVPTARAETLRAPLARCLREARAIVEAPAAVHPSTLARTFTIAATNYAAIVALPAIAGRLARTAPGVALRVEPLDLGSKAAQFRALMSGGLDLVLGLFPRDLRMPAGFVAETLSAERLMVIGRRGHPVLAARPSLPALRKAAFVGAGAARRGDPIDSWLMARGFTPRIAVVAPSLDAAARISAASDLLLVAGERITQTAGLPLVAAPLPFRLAPLSLLAAWAERAGASSAETWFRSEVCAAVKG